MGIVAAAGSIGGVCFPLILAWLNGLPGLGYAWSLRAVALIVAYVRLSLRFFAVNLTELEKILGAIGANDVMLILRT